MKILHVSQSDSDGGAAIAARRLHNALRAPGIDSRMFVIRRESDDPTIEAPLGRAGLARTRAARFVAKRLAAALHRGEPGMRSVGLVTSGLADAINRANTDLVHLHWIGAEAMSIGEVASIRKPLVWTLHDMWAIRGADHYSERPPDSGVGIDRWVWRRKVRNWRSLNAHLIAPSRWMAAQARQYNPFGRAEATVIPNTLNPSVFRIGERNAARAALGLPSGPRILLFGARDPIRDQRKGFDLLEASLHALRSSHERESIALAVFGAVGSAKEIAGLPAFWLGQVRGDAALARCYAAADALALPSRIDNLPNTVLEAQFCGLPCAAFDVGGLADLVIPGETGCLAQPFDTKSLATAIAASLSMGEAARSWIRDRALARFSPEMVTTRHKDLYRRVLAGTGTNHQESG